MREIKFRAYNNHTNAILFFTLEDVMGWNKGEGVYSDQWDIVQFIGLKDRNGASICEGDIYQYLKYKFTDDSGEDIYEQKRYSVEFGSTVCGSGYQLMTHPSNVEVIGNIYSSPELLKDTE